MLFMRREQYTNFFVKNKRKNQEKETSVPIENEFSDAGFSTRINVWKCGRAAAIATSPKLIYLLIMLEYV